MLIVRRHRVREIPAVSMAVVVLAVVVIVHGVAVRGAAIGPLLLQVGLPGVLFLAYALFALRGVERSGDRVRWGRLMLGSSCKAARSELRGMPHQGGRATLLTVELVEHGQPVVEVTTLNDDGTADAQAQRIADALELRYTRVPTPQPAQ